MTNLDPKLFIIPAVVGTVAACIKAGDAFQAASQQQPMASDLMVAATAAIIAGASAKKVWNAYRKGTP